MFVVRCYFVSYHRFDMYVFTDQLVQVLKFTQLVLHALFGFVRDASGASAGRLKVAWPSVFTRVR